MWGGLKQKAAGDGGKPGADRGAKRGGRTGEPSVEKQSDGIPGDNK